MAVREPDRLFVNGVDLGKRWFLTVESTYQMPAQVRDGMVETPGRHGAHVSGRPPVYDVGAGKLVLHVGGEGRGHLREVLDELIGLLTGGSEVVLMHASGGKARQAVIEVQSWNVTERVPQVFADLEVSYVVPGVFLRSLTTTDRSVPAGTSVLPRAGTAPVTDAVVRFAGPSSGAHTVTEDVWGTGVTWTGSLVSGQHVFIDPRAMRAWTGAAIDWHRPASARDVSTGLSPATAGPLALHHTTGWGAGAVTATNYAPDPFYEYGAPTASQPFQAVVGHAPNSGRDGTGALQARCTGPAQVTLVRSPAEAVAGQVVRARAWVRHYASAIVTFGWNTSGSHRTTVSRGGAWVESTWTLTGSTSYLYLVVSQPPGSSSIVYVDDLTVTVDDPLPAEAFSGDTPDTDALVYEWTGTPGASTSTVARSGLTRSTPLTASKAATIRYKEAWL